MPRSAVSPVENADSIPLTSFLPVNSAAIPPNATARSFAPPLLPLIAARILSTTVSADENAGSSIVPNPTAAAWNPAVASFHFCAGDCCVASHAFPKLFAF